MDLLLVILAVLGLLAICFIGLVISAFLAAINRQIEEYRAGEFEDD
jgi:hypothetical protein